MTIKLRTRVFISNLRYIFKQQILELALPNSLEISVNFALALLSLNQEKKIRESKSQIGFPQSDEQYCGHPELEII